MPYKITVSEINAGNQCSRADLYEQIVDTIDIPTLVRLINPQELGVARIKPNTAHLVALHEAVAKELKKRKPRGE